MAAVNNNMVCPRRRPAGRRGGIFQVTAGIRRGFEVFWGREVPADRPDADQPSKPNTDRYPTNMDTSETNNDHAGLFQTDFPPDEFARRRSKIFDAIGKDARALVPGAPPVRGFGIFRQSNEFYYCCGLETPQAYLLLDGAKRRAAVYLPHREAGSEGEGGELAAEDADLIEARTGLDGAHAIEMLSGHLGGVSVLYTPHSPPEGFQACRGEVLRCDRKILADPWDSRLPRYQHLIDLLKTRHPAVEIRDLSPVLDALRAVKSPAEIEIMRRTGHLAALAVIEAMRSTRGGLVEYQLGAVADYVFGQHGARGQGYRAIIASGPNAWFGHYFRNNRVMQDGELVLMDVAPDLGNYTSDIGRMWPIGGTYTPTQRELYGFIVEYHKVLLERIRPGVLAEAIMEESAAEMGKVVEATEFSKPVYEQAARKALQFKGHLSHPVGMAVHDVGRYRDKPLAPGAVFSVDPQMWVPEEKLYIRVEDTIVVTSDGIENLTAAAPLGLDDVEALMREQSPLPRPAPPAV